MRRRGMELMGRCRDHVLKHWTHLRCSTKAGLAVTRLGLEVLSRPANLNDSLSREMACPALIEEATRRGWKGLMVDNVFGESARHVR